jgi:hypothetical protein
VKNGYSERIISNEHIQILSEFLKGHFFYFPRGNQHSDCIKNEAIDSFRSWINSGDAKEEHMKWLRISNSEARTKRDGITPEGMEIKGVTG